jgi:hypothetical protein
VLSSIDVDGEARAVPGRPTGFDIRVHD